MHASVMIARPAMAAPRIERSENASAGSSEASRSFLIPASLDDDGPSATSVPLSVGGMAVPRPLVGARRTHASAAQGLGPEADEFNATLQTLRHWVQTTLTEAGSHRVPARSACAVQPPPPRAWTADPISDLDTPLRGRSAVRCTERSHSAREVASRSGGEGNR